MGLDITAYKKLHKVENPVLDEYGDPQNYDTQWKPGGSMDWSESVWPGKGYPIEPNAVYEWEESFNFRAGSYIGYNIWRDELDKFKGNVAFQELIDFADNEGVIGTKLSQKLKEDFQRHHDEAQAFANSDDCQLKWFMDAYEEWETAFELASNDGAIEFH